MLDKFNIIHPKKISLKNHPNLNEAWLQELIAGNPEMLGLGDVVLRDKERKQPSGGRLDLLLQDVDTLKRYEMEIQLGKTDETHIIRTIEYWDVERKRYPQYEHCAVIVAEEITSRFLNVIGLFNGHIPLIALKVSAYEHDDKYFIVFNKILDELQLGLVDEDEVVYEAADRNYWLERGTKKTVETVDRVLNVIKTINPDYELKYNKFYIGLSKNNLVDNFVLFRPQRKITRMEIRMDKSQEIEESIENSGLELLDYFSRDKRYRINLKYGDVDKYKNMLITLFKIALNIETDSEVVCENES